MKLTPEQILEIQKIIELHHYAFIANNLGSDALPDEVKKDLEAKGLLNDESKALVKQAYRYGQSLSQLDDPNANKITYQQYQDYVKKNPPLTAMEQNAVKMAELNAGQYCRGLGNVIEKDTGRLLIEADRDLRIKFEDDIKTTTARALAQRKSAEQLKSDLGWATDDWARDLKRIAVTEIAYATQQGQSDYLRKKYGPDEYVAKIPNPGACPHCIRLHIGPDGQPRIFKLSTLEENNNVGKKASDWEAVIGPVHPNCVCSMVRVPKGWGFDEEGELVPNGKLGVKYEEPKALERAFVEENEFKKSLEVKEEFTYQGLPIAIETREGEKRTWVTSTGEMGETYIQGASYGYVKNTTSMDEEELDVFIGPYKEAPMVYVIDQRNPDNDLYDEQKCMLGFRNRDHAIATYRANYDLPDSYICEVSQMDIEAFKRWCGFGINEGELGKSNNSDRAPAISAGVNFIEGSIKKKVKPKKEDRKEFNLNTSNTIYGDKEDYVFENTVIPVHKLVIPEHIKKDKKKSRKNRYKETTIEPELESKSSMENKGKGVK